MKDDHVEEPSASQTGPSSSSPSLTTAISTDPSCSDAKSPNSSILNTYQTFSSSKNENLKAKTDTLKKHKNRQLN